MIGVSRLRVKRVKDVQLGHLVALPQENDTLLGIVVESPPEFKGARVVLALAFDTAAGKMPYLLLNSGVDQCFDFGAPATFIWPPSADRISPRWHAGLKTGHLVVTENVVAINGCYGKQHIKHGYWDIVSGRMVWDKYTMFLTEWQLGLPGVDRPLDVMLTFPADFENAGADEITQKIQVAEPPAPRSMTGG